jgi:hypothetical protein
MDSSMYETKLMLPMQSPLSFGVPR